MKFLKNRTANSILFSVIIILLFFIVSLLSAGVFGENTLVPLLFTLAVFLISLFTSGYIYGIISSVIGITLIYAVDTVEINIPEALVSLFVMLLVSTLTFTLKDRLKKREAMWQETEKEKMRANLLRAVSHDLRTPLTAIYGAGSALLENYDILPKDETTEILKGIKEDSEWLINMMENLLSVTKIENSNLQIIKTSVVLEELIDSVLAKFKKRYPDTKAEISIPNDFITVSCDPILIEQVLFNIMQNAVEHAKGMTKVILKASVLENKALFEVIDDGEGIKKEKLKNLFSAHFPSDTDASHMGVGLSVCSTIVNAHGANIKAENIKPKGARFFFTLLIEEENTDE